MIRTVPLPWIGECYADEARPFSTQDICNWLPSQAEVAGTLSPWRAKTPPGLFPYLEIPAVGSVPSKPVRGTYNCENKLFATIGNTLYQISNTGVAIPRGTIPGVTRTASAHNQITQGNQLVTVNGSSGYCYNTATQVFERIIDPGFAGGISADFIDGYILCIEPGRRFVGHSDLANALEWNTLDRFTSEYRPDLLVAGAVINNDYLLLSEQSGEFFGNTGNARQPFRTKRIFLDVGCSGRSNAQVVDNTVLWHGSDGKFYELDGYAARRISTRPIEQAVRGLKWSEAFAQVWDDGGHSVVYWTFPGGHTWGFDRSSRKWHRRASLGMDRWRVNTLTKWRQDWYAGDFQTGRIWRLDWDYMLEGEDEFVSECTGPVIHDNQNPLTMARCELLMDVGHELTGPGVFGPQPEGPSISGAAPDGVIDTAYPGYAYTLSGGSGSYAVTLRSGILPPGVTLSTAGVLSSTTATAAGPYPITIRNTDTVTGLYADLDDTINIAAAFGVMMAQPRAGNPIVSIDGGVVWTLAANAPLAGNEDIKALASGRFIGGARYTDDLGATAWDVSASGGLGNYQMTRRGDSVVTGASGPFSPTVYSADNGASWAGGGASGNATYSVVYSGDSGPLVGVGEAGNFLTSTDNGSTFASTGVAHGFECVSNTDHASCKYSGGAVFAGRNVGLTTVRLVCTADGVSVTGGNITGLGSSSTGVGKRPSAICAGEVAGVETIVLLGNLGGELFWTQDAGVTVHLITEPLGAGVTLDAIAWNGSRFVLGGVNGSTGVLKHSTDLVTWTACTEPGGSQGYHAIASQLP